MIFNTLPFISLDSKSHPPCKQKTSEMASGGFYY